MSCRRRLARARVEAWEEYQPALSGVIAHYTESFETEDSLNWLLKFHPLKIVRSVFILFWSNSHTFMFKLTKNQDANIGSEKCDRLTVPCASFLSPDWSLCLLVILFQQCADLWTTLLATAANVKACEDQWSYCMSQKKKATDCKVNETKKVPLQKALLWSTPDRRIALHHNNQRQFEDCDN